MLNALTNSSCFNVGGPDNLRHARAPLQRSSAERPDTFNFACWANPAADALIEAGRVEPDLAERARIYRDYAIRISEDLPVIYAWSDLVREGIRSSIGTTAPGGLRLDTPTWTEPLERLTNVR